MRVGEVADKSCDRDREEQGGTVEILRARRARSGGVCVFDDGSECDEWAFYRGECAPG